MAEIYYIGGSPCSGKSSIAERLAELNGLAYYKQDDHLWEHIAQAAQRGGAHSQAELELDFEGMWMRDPGLQRDEEAAIYEEIFPLALEAIAAMGDEKPIVAEGAGFMPRLMARHEVAQNRYICIVPTEAFQRENYAKRPWIGEFLKGCTDPDTAFDNWMSRDALFAREVLRQAEAQGCASIVVDGTADIPTNLRAVAAHFGLVGE